LLFLVLLIGSFGTVFIVYIVMWLVIPPERKAGLLALATGMNPYIPAGHLALKLS
jgi:hypothetical protein